MYLDERHKVDLADMGPGKYDPKTSLTTKNVMKTKFVSERVKPNNAALKLEKIINRATIEGRKQDYFKMYYMIYLFLGMNRIIQLI